MPSILPILNYADMFKSPFTLESQEVCGSNPFLSLTWKTRIPSLFPWNMTVPR